MAKASIQLKGMLVVYLVSLSRAWTNVALGRSASGDTVLVARVVPVASVHTSPSFSLGSSSQADKAFLASVEYDGCLRQRDFWKQQWVERSKDVNKESPQHTRTQGNHLYVKCSSQRSPGTAAKECKEPKLAHSLVVNSRVNLLVPNPLPGKRRKTIPLKMFEVNCCFHLIDSKLGLKKP